jgi:hypothetical protein
VIQITCVLGQVGQTTFKPDFPLRFQDKAVEQHFAEASKRDIDLTIDNSHLNDIFRPERQTVDATVLHLMLSMLTGNSVSTVRPLTRISVIFAGAYKNHESVYGVMFDRGVPQPDDPRVTPSFHAIPREGCAIFLDAIARSVGDANENLRQAEVAYATIHELGHVFNLIHNDLSANFMHESKTAVNHSGAQVQFADIDRERLSRCSDSPDVFPGGDKFRDVVSAGQFILGASNNQRPVKRLLGLNISIDMRPREFWRFEPVELDLTLSVGTGIKRTFNIPDRIDPGYPEFTIWIEEPDGERRRYAAERHYCAARSNLRIGPGRPFERDISIFLEQGMFTFKKAGVHRITSVLDLGKRGVLISNTLDVNVIAYPGAKSASLECSEVLNVLAGKGTARFLYHRRGNPRNKLLRRLEQFSSSRIDRHSIAVSYALGRSFITSAEEAGSPEVRKRLERRGRELLVAARDSGLLSAHRMRLCGRILEDS